MVGTFLGHTVLIYEAEAPTTSDVPALSTPGPLPHIHLHASSVSACLCFSAHIRSCHRLFSCPFHIPHYARSNCFMYGHSPKDLFPFIIMSKLISFCSTSGFQLAYLLWPESIDPFGLSSAGPEGIRHPHT